MYSNSTWRFDRVTPALSCWTTALQICVCLMQEEGGPVPHHASESQSPFNLLRPLPSSPNNPPFIWLTGKRARISRAFLFPAQGVVKTVPGLIPKAMSCHILLTSQGCYGMEPSLTLLVSRFTARKQQSRGLNTQAQETLLCYYTIPILH